MLDPNLPLAPYTPPDPEKVLQGMDQDIQYIQDRIDRYKECLRLLQDARAVYQKTIQSQK